MDPPFTLETDQERRISEDPAWQVGAAWGLPRPGHPEGQVAWHIADVLANIERVATTPDERRQLRLLALVHDSFKYQVDRDQPVGGENHHAMRARRFAERYVDDPAVLDVIELHDEAFNSWRSSRDGKNWPRAEQRATRLVERLGDALPLYCKFYLCDNETEGKDQEPVRWFQDLVATRQTLG